MFEAQQCGKEDTGQENCRLVARQYHGEYKDTIEKAIVLEVDVVNDEKSRRKKYR